MSDSCAGSRVEGAYLVVPTKTALPQRCVVTNQPVTEALYTAWELPFVRSWIVFFLFGPLLLLFSPIIVRRRCMLKAGVSKEVRRRYLLLKVAMLLLGVSPLVLVAVAIDLRSEDLLLSLGFPGVVVVYVAAFVFIYHTTPLKVVREEDGLYWIKGCSIEFLDSLEA